MEKLMPYDYPISGWWLSHPSEKYDFVSWDDDINPILMGKCQTWQPVTTNQPYILSLHITHASFTVKFSLEHMLFWTTKAGQPPMELSSEQKSNGGFAKFDDRRDSRIAHVIHTFIKCS